MVFPREEVNFPSLLLEWKEQGLAIIDGLVKNIYESEHNSHHTNALLQLAQQIGNDFYVNKLCKVSALTPQIVEEQLAGGIPFLTTLISYKLIGPQILFAESQESLTL